MADYTQDKIKVEYQSQSSTFKSGEILTADQMNQIDRGLVGAASAEKVAAALQELDDSVAGLNTKINNTTNDLTDRIDEKVDSSVIGDVPQDKTIMEKIAERGVNLSFDENTNLLHMVYEDGTKSTGIPVAQDLEGYATEQYVQDHVKAKIGNIGDGKTVSDYVNERVQSVDISGQLENYYTKAAIDNITLEAQDGDEKTDLIFTTPNGVEQKVVINKTPVSDYYTARKITKDPFSFIVGNDATPQQIEYQTGHWSGNIWDSSIYYEQWRIERKSGSLITTLRRTNRFVEIGSENRLAFDFIPYADSISNGESVVVSMAAYASSDYTGAIATLSWEIKKIDFSIKASYPNPQKCGEMSQIVCEVPSGIEKTLVLYLDDLEKERVRLGANINRYEFELTSFDHGEKRIRIEMEGQINGSLIPATPSLGTAIWYDVNNSTPIMGVNKNTYSVQQYDEVAIDIFAFVYMNGTSNHNLNLKIYTNEHDEESEELILDDTAQSGQTYKYKYPAETKKDNIVLRLVLANGELKTEKKLSVSVSEGNYDFTEVKGSVFSLIPKKYSNNSFSLDNTLTISNGVTLTLGKDFNLNAGGFGKTANEYYFKIPVFNRAYISGKELFNEEKDSHFKIVFKTENVRQNKSVFMKVGRGVKEEFVQSPDGFEFTTHEGQIKANSETIVTSVFTPDDIIDYSFNVVNPSKHQITFTEDNVPEGYRVGDYSDLTLAEYMIMPYEDGVASLPKLHSSTSLDELFVNGGDCIEIGSDNCDVYIYCIRCYHKALGIDEICTNFIADGTNLNERRQRYNKNKWTLSTDNILKNPALASELMPEVKIVLITAGQFTNDKSNKIEDTYVQVLQKQVKDGTKVVDGTKYNWIANGCMHSGQGTSSNDYGFSGRNLTLDIKGDVYEGATEIFNGATAEDFQTYLTNTQLQGMDKSQLRIRPGTKAANIFNIKLNIASSENQNNAQMAHLYNLMCNEIYKRPAKLRDSEISDTMNFDNCLVYIRETDSSKTNRREFLVDEEGFNSGWHFYGLGNFGDHKDTDVTRLDHKWNGTEWVQDKLETIVEITDFNVSLCGFSDHTKQNGKTPFGGFSENGDYIEIAKEDYPTFDNLLTHKTNLTITNDKGHYGEHYGYYKWDSDKKKYKFEGFGVASLLEEKEEDGVLIKKENIECSYEFRYENEDITLAERDHNVEIWNDFYRQIYPLYVELNNKLQSAYTEEAKELAIQEAIDKLEEYMIVDSAILFFLFTERFSLIDNRAKNSFWHYSKKFYTEEEARGLPSKVLSDMRTAGMISDEKGGPDHHNGYRWDLCFGYDFDTCLGIDNIGALAFEYGQETKDRIFRTDVSELDENLNVVSTSGFNYFFETIQKFGFSVLSSRFSKVAILMSASGENGTINRWNNAQKQFPEKIWLRDYERKYLRTAGNFRLDGSITALDEPLGYYTDTVKSKEPKPEYFLEDKANGLKRYHRADFEKKQSLYMSSRWPNKNSMSDYLTFRFKGSQGAPGGVQVGFMQKCYYNYATSSEANDWREPVLNTRVYGEEDFQTNTISATGEYLHIYPASEMAVLNFPRSYENGRNLEMETALSLNAAKKLSEFSIGTDSSTQRPSVGFTNTTFDECKMLKKIDITNCKSYQGDNARFAIYLTGNVGFEEIRAGNSALGRITFAPNGMLTTAILNSNIENISLINPFKLTTLTIPTDNKINALRLENCPDTINTFALINSLLSKPQPTLTRLRLIGINWTEETSSVDTIQEGNILDRIGALSGFDEMGNNIDKDKNENGHGGSVLTGYIKVGKLSTRKESAYESWWDIDIEAVPGGFVEEVNAKFYIYNPRTEQINLLMQTLWAQPGDTVDVPENPPTWYTKDRKHPFNKWDQLPQDTKTVILREDKVFYAEYNDEIRKYNIKWMLDETNPIIVNNVPYVTQISYGEGAIYNGPIPTKPKDNTRLPLFYGWNKYIYRPEPEQLGVDEYDKPIFSNDILVTAQFKTGTSPSMPTYYQGLSGLGGIETINAICAQGEELGEEKLLSTALDHGDTIDLQIGWDPDDDPHFTGTKLFDLFAQPVTAYKINNTSQQVLLTSPLVLNHDKNSYYYIDTKVKLCDTLWGPEDNKEFTIVMDYQFIDNEVDNGDAPGQAGTTIASQYLLDCSQQKVRQEQRLQLYRENNGFYFYNKSHPVAATRSHMGTTKYKLESIAENGEKKYSSWNALGDWSTSDFERIIIRKKKGSRTLTVIRSNPTVLLAEIQNRSNRLPTGAIKYEVTIEGTELNTNTLLLGCKNNTNSTNRKNSRCNASISNFKIWSNALSDTELEKMSIAPKEKVTLQLVHFPRDLVSNTEDPNNPGKNLVWYKKANGEKAAGLLLETRDLLRNFRPYVHTKYGNDKVAIPWDKPMGWNNSEIRDWLNERIYPALPEIWKSAIKNVEVWGYDSSGECKKSDDKLFILSLSEYKGTETSEGTGSEIFTGPSTRIKFTEIGGNQYSWYNRTRTAHTSSSESPTWNRITESGGFDSSGGATTVAAVGFALCI